MASGPGDGYLPAEVVEAELEHALSTSKVQTVMAAMRKAGCPVSRSYFQVEDCKLRGAMGGGYSPVHGVILCRNQLWTASQVHSTVLHELVHAYDDCRARPHGLDWDDCQQHACTEVRAASLSGDCDWSQEAWRGNVSHASPTSWLGYHRRCVERRAALSVALNPKCKDPGCAAEAVQRVVERCMQDTAPFENQASS